MTSQPMANCQVQTLGDPMVLPGHGLDIRLVLDVPASLPSAIAAVTSLPPPLPAFAPHVSFDSGCKRQH